MIFEASDFGFAKEMLDFQVSVFWVTINKLVDLTLINDGIPCVFAIFDHFTHMALVESRSKLVLRVRFEERSVKSAC